MIRHILHCVAALAITALALSLPGPASAAKQKQSASCGIMLAGCPGGQFCQAPPGLCATNIAGGGTCTLVPQVCTTVNQPVCGCDGRTYLNDCKRRQARVSKGRDGRC